MSSDSEPSGGLLRRRFIQAGLGAITLPLLAASRERKARERKDNMPAGTRMPVLFVGHGSPMNAIEDNNWSHGFESLADLVPKPKAILAVSAHWFIGGTSVTSNERPPTIHDFGGFPEELFAVEYPAPGSVDLARQVVKLLGADRASLRGDWGLDHGTWSVLHRMIPKADVPVVQLSLDATMDPAGHLALGKELASLRDEGVLILGSGNVTHNLRYAMRSMHTGDNATPDWAAKFDVVVKESMEQHDGDALVRAVATDFGRMAHPTLDHYLPMLYALGAAKDSDKVSFPISGFDAGPLSMRSVLLG